MEETEIREQAHKSSGKGTASRSQGLLLGAKVFNILLGFFVTIIWGRYLDPADFGFLAMVTLVLGLSRDLVGLGTGNLVTREIVRDPKIEGDLLGRLLGLRRLQVGALAALCLGFAFFQHQEYQEWTLVLVAVVLYLYHFGALQSVFQVRQQYEWPVLFNVSGQALFFGGCLLVIQREVSAADFSLLLVAREAFVILGAKIKAERLLGYKPVPRFRLDEFDPFLRKVFTFGFATLFYMLYFFSGSFLVWFILGEDPLGGFLAAFRPMSPLFSFPWLYVLPLIPVFSWLAREDRAKFTKLFRGNLDLLIGVGAIGMISGIYLGPSWLEVLYAGKFSEGELSAIGALKGLCLAFGFSCVNPLLVAGLLALEEEKKLLKLVGIAFLANLVCNIYLLPGMGFTAAGFCLAISEIITFAGGIFLLSGNLGSARDVRHLFSQLIPALVLFLIYSWVDATKLLPLVLLTGLGILAVIVLLKTPSARNFRRELAVISREQNSTLA